MSRNVLFLALLLSLILESSCAPSVPAVLSTETPSAASLLKLTASPTVAPSLTPSPTATSSPTPLPTVAELGASVTADLLSCRYGPGPNYLFLYGLRKGANIRLVGRTDGDNWHWVYVAGKNKCWVNTEYLGIQGNWQALPVVYPDIAKLPVSPYYGPTSVVRVNREKDQITVQWVDIPLRPGDEEDQFMQHYVVELWRCQNGQLLFEPMATNDASITFTDEQGCAAPSHGRIFVQEKHGFAGPSEIPWPPYQP